MSRIAAAIAAPALEPLLEAWRVERTSDLADAIELVDLALRPEAPLPPRLDEGEHEAWIASLPETGTALGGWLDELCARAWESRGFEEVAAAWSAIAKCTHALAALPPDPRIGRAIERMLWSSSDHWFRVDQVAHIVPVDKPDDEPSFADHALPLLIKHADRGTAARLQKLAHLISVEADCNGGEMSSRLREQARRLAPRSSGDRTLDEMTTAQLRCLPRRPRAGTTPRHVLGPIEALAVLGHSDVAGELWRVRLRRSARLTERYIARNTLAPEWQRVAALHANGSFIHQWLPELTNLELLEDLDHEDTDQLFGGIFPRLHSVACRLGGGLAPKTLGWLFGAIMPELRRVKLVGEQPAGLEFWRRWWNLVGPVTRFETHSTQPIARWLEELPRMSPSIQTLVIDPEPRAEFVETDVILIERDGRVIVHGDHPRFPEMLDGVRHELRQQSRP